MFLSSLFFFLFLALLAYNVITYLHATGSVWDRLSAVVNGDKVLFALIYTTIAAVFMDGMDWLSNITGDPQFGQLASVVKDKVPAELAPWISFGVLFAPLVVAAFIKTAQKKQS